MSTKPTIKINIEATKVGFTFCDNTGKFSNSNPTGWKPGDWSINNVSSAQIKITNPDGTSATLIVTDMPSHNCVCRELLPNDFGLEEFVSGKYKIDYTISFSTSPIGATVIMTTTYMYHLGKVKCCIDNKINSICDYDSETTKKVYFMNLLLESASLAVCKGDETKANNILDYLNNKCNCKCC